MVRRVAVPPRLQAGGDHLDVGLLAGDILPALVLTGFGLGLAFVPVIGLGTGDAEERDGGLASGLMTTAQQIGGALGIAALITIATDRTSDLLATGATPAVALTEGFQTAFRVEAGIMVAAGVLAIAGLRSVARGRAQSAQDDPGGVAARSA